MAENVKAHRKVSSPLFQSFAAEDSSSGTNESGGDLRSLHIRILGELSKVRHSQLSDAVASRTKDRRSIVETALRRMLECGLVCQPKNSKSGFKITEAGRAALLAADPRSHDADDRLAGK